MSSSQFLSSDTEKGNKKWRREREREKERDREKERGPRQKGTVRKRVIRERRNMYVAENIIRKTERKSWLRDRNRKRKMYKRES